MAAILQPIQPNKDRSWWLSLFFLCAILGALLGLSFRTQQKVQHVLGSSSVSGMTEGYLLLKKQVSDQQRTIAALQQNTSKLEQTSGSSSKQAQVLAEDLKQAKFLAGLTEVSGPGVLVILNDSKKGVPATLPEGIPPPNMIHDTDINQTVNELKAAGAEAISINNQRVVATTPVRCAGPTVYVNMTPQTPPYRIRAIGDPKTLQDAINLPQGVADSISQFDADMIKVQKIGHMVVPAYSGATQPKYAKVVAVSGSDPGDSAKG